MKLKDFDKLDYYLKRHLEAMDYMLDDISRTDSSPETLSAIVYLLSLSCAEISEYQQKLEIYVTKRYKKKAAKRREKNMLGG